MNKNSFATILLTLLLSMMSTNTFAYDAEIDGIYYNLIIGKAAKVTSGDNKYSGDVVIPEKVTYEGVEYPVESIGNYAFDGCSSLTSITIPNSVTSIGIYAFQDCKGLTSITIPSSVTSFEYNAFIGCSGLTSVHITDLEAWCNINFETSNSNPLYAAHHLFLNNKEITDLVIPDGINIVKKYSFYYCLGLTSVTIPNSVANIESCAFQSCQNITSVIIPNSVTSIGDLAFSDCRSLISLTIPNSITSIEFATFQNCRSLTSLYIPNSVTTIEGRAFAYCDGLNSVISQATVPPEAYDNTFTNYNIPLYVPDEALSDYKTTIPWSSFSTIKAIEKCATPTISYHNGKLTFNCETEGVEYRSSITDTDIKDYTTQEIDLTVTYTIKVYATKTGYQDSDVATGTLCWIDVEPRKEGITDGVAQVKAMPVMITSNGGQLTVEGAADDTMVSVFNAAGVQQGSAVSKNGLATISTSLGAGSVAIVKIGQKAVKVVMK